MSRRGPLPVITENVDAHPAVRAWCRLGTGLPLPEAVELLRGAEHKTPIARLLRLGGGDASVVAKLTRTSDATIEQTVYERAARHLAARTLRCYGCVPAGGDTSWIFTEDAGGGPFSFEDEGHRRLAVDWFAALHTSVPRLECFPDRGIGYYRSCMAAAREKILGNMGNDALNDADRALLGTILTHFDVIDRRWETIRDLDAHLPKGLIHGDLKPGNLRVREEGGKRILLVFDWEESGWGLPGVDMWQLDSESYWTRVRERWPGTTLEDVQHLSCLGKLLWCLPAIGWEAEYLAFPFVRPTMDYILPVHEEQLRDALRRAELLR